MTKNNRVAYQGIKGSYSENAAKILSKMHGLESPVLIPCVSSERVVTSLIDSCADFGVVAVRNSTAGIVEETEEAIRNFQIIYDCKTEIPISHCLFVQSRSFNEKIEIQHIFSHPQALAQCDLSIKKNFPNAIIHPMADTSLAAQSLAAGSYGMSAAVICSKNAGEDNNLHLIFEGFQDDHNNRTEFNLIHIKGRSIPENKNFKDIVAQHLGSESILQYATKGTIVLSILAAFLLKDYLGWSSIRSATVVAGVTAAFVLMITSQRLYDWLLLHQLKGYWRYSVIPKFGLIPVAQKHHLGRVIHIDKGDHGLRIQGWWQGDCSAVRWESTAILTTSPGKLKGKLTYWYTNIDGDNSEDFDGITSVSWTRSSLEERINRMTGWYLGIRNGDIGTIVFERISKEDASIIKYKMKEQTLNSQQL